MKPKDAHDPFFTYNKFNLKQYESLLSPYVNPYGPYSFAQHPLPLPTKKGGSRRKGNKRRSNKNNKSNKSNKRRRNH